MRILVIGAGAVGGYFGGRLTAAGRDVTFLVRSARAEQLRRTGLQIVSPHGDVTVQPRLLLAQELRASGETFDLVLLSTKSYSLEAAMDDFAPAVGPSTSILPLLNGMRHLDILAQRFGEDPVLGGTTRIVADLDADGRVLQMEQLHDLTFGERGSTVQTGVASPRLQAIRSALEHAGFEEKLSANIVAAMWNKWVFLAALGATTCLLRGSVGAVVAAPGGLETARGLLAECEAIASANGHPTPPALLETIAGRVFQAGSPLTASMYRDMTRGRPVEADAILGDLLRRGQAHQVEAPLLQAAYAQLSVYATSLQPA